MRPVKLTMTAYGPYAGTESVDFREAIASGLFGIYGSTGSGKSTIFSAMMFALFGKLSRSEQDPQSVRSDHAAPEILTSVEFIFGVGEKQFRIRRIPDQSRPKKSGDGETTETHKAWIFDVSDIELDDISESNPGQIIQEKKVGLVQEVINDLLGYGPEQFRQIVLLPQGRFETFLTAKTDERKKILSELFDVSLYQSLARSFKDKAQNAVRTVQAERDSCAARLKQEDFESTDALREGIVEAKKHVATMNANANEAKRCAATKQKQKSDGEQIAKDYEQHVSAAAELASLSKKLAEVADQEKRLKALLAAKALEDVGDVFKSAADEVTRSEGFLKSAIQDQEFATGEKERAEAKLKTQQDREGDREAERKKVEALKRYQVTLTDAQRFLTDWQTKRSVFENATTAYDISEAKLSEINDSLEKAIKLRDDASQSLIKRSELAAQITKAEQVLAAAKTYEDAQRSVNELEPQITAQKACVTKAKNTLSTAEAELNRAENDLSTAQAQHLASKLKNGEPCDVCGSLDHPNPANGTAESSGLDRAFRIARDKQDTARRSHDVEARKIATLENRKADRMKSLEALTRPTQSFKDAQKTLGKLNSDLAALGTKKDLNTLKADIDRYSQSKDQSKSAVEDAKSAMNVAKTEALLAKQVYDSALSTIPEALRDSARLETAVNAADAKYNSSVKAFEEAQIGRNEANEALATKKAAQKAAEEKLKDAKIKHTNATNQFAERLSASGLTTEIYQRLKPEIIEIEALQNRISAHQQSFAVAKDRLKQATERIKDKDQPDIVALTTAAEAADQAALSMASESAKASARLDHLQKLQDSLAAEIAKINKMEADTVSLRELAALFNGSNSAKIELETFAIGAMFDQVLQAANLRLGPMTSGRYSLERAMESKGSGKRGLGINVHDIHTGKARATSTLSGGETFIAALSLALGLSDIVESTNGNIRLDTIFIDEGFGSLDTENDAGTLDQVLQTLQDLVGDHRAVGLISHVPLVQQAIPNGFSILKTPNGSHIEAKRI